LDIAETCMEMRRKGKGASVMPDNDNLQSNSLAELVHDMQESLEESTLATKEALARTEALLARQRRRRAQEIAPDNAAGREKGEGTNQSRHRGR
jgi:hypothetical protein